MNDRSFLHRATPGGGAAGGRRAPDRSPLRTALVLAVALFGTGCGSSLGSAVRDYEHGRYPEAMDELRVIERDVGARGTKEATRYALYRGLAHLALGDTRAARFWLARVQRVTAAGSDALTSDETARLASAWAHLPR